MLEVVDEAEAEQEQKEANVSGRSPVEAPADIAASSSGRD